MNELNKEKSDFKSRELDQLLLARKIWEKEREVFGYSDLQEYVTQSKNDDDLLLIMERFTEWSELVKEIPEKKKVYTDLLKASYRVHSYCFNLQTTVQHAVAMLKTEKDLHKNVFSNHLKDKLSLTNKIKQLEQEVSSLKSEIEFLEKK